MRIVKRFILSVLCIVLFAVPAVVFVKRQDIMDWSRLRNYQPPAEVARLTEATSMTDYGQKLFYVNRPQILRDKAEFSNACQQTEQTIVLGCHISGTGIYLYQVSDKRLDGIVEVTAAHEMLHEAYERLSEEERLRVDALLRAEFDRTTSQRIKDTIARYGQQDPSVVPNELHSVIGAELRSISKELETYYARYFSKRTEVVALSERYEQEFSERRGKVAQYDVELGVLQASINTQQSNIDQLAQALSDERRRLEDLEGSSGYIVAASSYNKKVAEYNVLVRELREDIDTYNSLVKKRNALAVEVQGLVNAMDSRPEIIQ